jgi:Ca2+/Na+ antiporter
MGIYGILLFVASTGIIISAENFSKLLGIGLPVVGMIIVGIANCAPETYSCIVAAKKRQTWAILGNLMGSVIMCATLVLGLVAIIHPIANIDFSPFAVARVFLMLAAVFFLVIIKTDQRITRDEGFFLIGIYAMFLICEVALYR